MKKILTLAAITVIFASNFASASNTNNGQVISILKVKTVKAKIQYTKLSAVSFDGKHMQDTKDSLMK